MPDTIATRFGFPAELSTHTLPSGAAELRIWAEVGAWNALIAAISPANPYLLVNLARGDVQSLPETDLGAPVIRPETLAQLPPDLLVNDSLHFAAVPANRAAAFHTAMQKLLNADAVTVLLSPLDRHTLTERLDIGWAWLLRPSTLQFQLSHGTQHLANLLLTEEWEYVTWSPQTKCFRWFLTPTNLPARLHTLTDSR